MSRFSIEAVFTALDRFTAPVRKMTSSLETLNKAQKNIHKFNASLRSGMDDIASFGRFAIGAGVAGAYGLASGIGAIADAFSKVETAQTNFRVMLDGNAELANKTVEQLRQKAADTSFSFNDLANAATRLFTSGAANTNNLDAKLTMLGDLAMGSPDKLERLSLVYSQITSNMKADTRDLQQFGDLGIPLKIEMMKDLGMETTQFKKALEDGKISSEMVEKTLRRLTGPGGRFFGALNERAKTLAGRWDNLTEKIQFAFAKIGKAAQPAMSRFVEFMIGKVDSLLRWLDDPTNAKKIADWADKFVDTLIRIVNFFENNWEEVLSALKWGAIIYGGAKFLLFLGSLAKALTFVWTIGVKAWTWLGKIGTLMSWGPTIQWIAGRLFLLWGAWKAGSFVGEWINDWANDIPVLQNAIQALLTPFFQLYDVLKSIKDVVTDFDLSKFDMSAATGLMKINPFFGGANFIGEAVRSMSDTPQVISPQERMVTTLTESKTTNTTKLIIEDKSGAAKLDEPKKANSMGVMLNVAGAF